MHTKWFSPFLSPYSGMELGERKNRKEVNVNFYPFPLLKLMLRRVKIVFDTPPFLCFRFAGEMDSMGWDYVTLYDFSVVILEWSFAIIWVLGGWMKMELGFWLGIKRCNLWESCDLPNVPNRSYISCGQLTTQEKKSLLTDCFIVCISCTAIVYNWLSGLWPYCDPHSLCKSILIIVNANISRCIYIPIASQSNNIQFHPFLVLFKSPFTFFLFIS